MCKDTTFLSSAEGHLGCFLLLFLFLVTVNRTVKNTAEQAPLYWDILLSMCQGVVWIGHMVDLLLALESFLY